MPWIFRTIIAAHIGDIVTEETGEVFLVEHFKNWRELFSILTGSVVDSNIDKRYHCQMQSYYHCLFCFEIDLTLCQPQSRLNKVVHGSSWIMLSWQSSSQVEMFFKERSTLCILRREKQSVIFANQGLVQAVNKLALAVNNRRQIGQIARSFSAPRPFCRPLLRHRDHSSVLQYDVYDFQWA